MLSLGMPWDNLELFQSDYCERFHLDEVLILFKQLFFS